VENILVCL